MVIDKPDVKRTLFWGEVVSWETPNTIKKDRGRYCITIKMTFASGDTVTKQYGTASTATEARKAIDVIAGKLYTKSFVPFKYTCEEYFNYWLYWYKLDSGITYNTFGSYKNAVKNYILPVFSKTYINNITSKDIIDFINDLDISPAIFKQIKGVFYSSFKYARANNIVSVNPVPGAMCILNNQYKQNYDPEKQIEVYTPAEIIKLIESARKYDNIFIPCLLAATCGLRISEALAVRRQDIDFKQKILHVRNQIGFSFQTEDERMTGLQKPKSKNSIRDIPLSENTLEEIMLVIKRNNLYYEKHPEVEDQGFLIFNKEGYAYSSSQLYRNYKKAVNDAGLKYRNFHTLRHSFATILNTDCVNLKAISDSMGHVNSDITDIYIYKGINVRDTSVVMNEFLASFKIDEEPQIYDSRVAMYHFFDYLTE